MVRRGMERRADGRAGTERHQSALREGNPRVAPQRKNAVVRRESPAARRERERRRKRNRQMRLLCGAVSLLMLGVILVYGVKILFRVLRADKAVEEEIHRIVRVLTDSTGAEPEDSAQVISNAGTVGWDTTGILSDRETEEKLQILAKEDTAIAEIYANRQEYPENLLKALVNNPEIADFVAGYLTADGTVTGGFGEEEKEQKVPLLLQWDSRWGYAPYGESCIGISGCAPTCLSMVIFGLTGNEDATPVVLAEYSMKNGYYVPGVGTAWLLMTDAAEDYGISACEIGLDETKMKETLDHGGLIICSMRPGDFTTAGHFIVICGYDQDGFIVNDPNSRERSEKRWTFDTLQYQIKNLWAYMK